MSQQEVELNRDVVATLIPHGEEFTLGRGEKVTITHRLGGNFTVMTLQGMYRIAARDADALGEDLEEASKLPTDGNAKPAGVDEIKENLKTVFDPESRSSAVIDIPSDNPVDSSKIMWCR